MKPYFLVAYNRIKLCMARMRTHGAINYAPVQMLNYTTKLIIKDSAKVTLGDRIVTDGRCVIIASDSATLHIGDHVYFNEDVMISCKGNISIGSGCLFGPNVKVFDNNHKFDQYNGVSYEHSIGSVIVGKNCWIGANTVLLKGTVIGDNCVIGAGCVIDVTIPTGSIVTQTRGLKIQPIRER